MWCFKVLWDLDSKIQWIAYLGPVALGCGKYRPEPVLRLQDPMDINTPASEIRWAMVGDSGFFAPVLSL